MPDAMVQDQNLLEELAALQRHLHRFDDQFPRKTIPPAPPWNPGFFFKLRHDPERMNREHIAADHYNCHRDGVFRELQKAAEEYHSRDFDPNKFKMGSSTAKEWIFAVKSKTLCRLYLDFTHARMREYAIYGCPQLDNECQRVESIRKPLHYLGWYAQILEYEAMAKVREERLPSLLDDVKSWTKRATSKEIELCRKAISDLQALKPFSLVTFTGKALRDLPPLKEEEFVRKFLAILEGHLDHASEDPVSEAEVSNWTAAGGMYSGMDAHECPYCGALAVRVARRADFH